jgi:hypothetical protein
MASIEEMVMPPLFKRISESLERRFGIAYSEYEETKESYLSMLNAARNRIYIVAGELDPRFYCGKFVDIIKKKLKENEGIIIDIIYHKKPEDNFEKVKEDLKKDNRSLYNLLMEIKDTPNSERLNIYWAEKRPKYHFSLADRDVFLEGIHEPGKVRDAFIKRNTVKLKDDYRGYFEDMVKLPEVHKLKF